MKNNFNKLLFIILISLLLLASTMVVSAESTDNLDIIVEKNIVIIQGTTAIGFDDVTLQIIRQDDGKRVYIDQVKRMSQDNLLLKPPLMKEDTA